MKGDNLIDAENFTEAITAAFRAWSPTIIPSSVNAIMNDNAALHLEKTVLSFLHIVDTLVYRLLDHYSCSERFCGGYW